MTREKAIESLEYVRELSGLKGCRESLAIDMAISALSQPERPKGRWIESIVIQTDTSELCEYTCSVCSIVTTRKSNFCPNCGADMRGEEE